MNEREAAWAVYSKDRVVTAVELWGKLYTFKDVWDAAWAAATAGRCIGRDRACPCQDGDMCHYKDAPDGTKAWPIPSGNQASE